MDPTDSEWLKEPAQGGVLVISADNLVIGEGLLDLTPAAAMATLVIGDQDGFHRGPEY